MNETRDNVVHCTAQLQGSVEDILIRVLDVNDNFPRFSELEPVHVLNVTENFNTPYPLLRLEPLDLDNGLNGTVDFYITSGNEENFFYIGPPLEYDGTDENRLELFFNYSVDHETHKLFSLFITLHDHGTPQLTSTQIIIVDINDVNDENPLFVMSVFEFDVEENHTLGPENPFGKVIAVDKDSIPSIMQFSLVNENYIPADVFDYIGLNNETGELYLTNEIDYETDISLRHMQFSIEVREKGMGAKVDIARVFINIKDVNEDRPELTVIIDKTSIPENVGDFQILLFRATDLDGVSTPIMKVDPPVSLLSFTVDAQGGALTSIKITEPLDREMLDYAVLNITVHDNGVPSLAKTLTVELFILDENDNPPTFTEVEYNSITIENVPLNHIVAEVEATDPDAGENGSVSYSITEVTPAIAEPWFSIDSLTGHIRVKNTLNYTLASRVSVTIKAEDNGTVKAYSTNSFTNATVHITISPSITFKPWSYQEHCLPESVKIQDSKIYMEFRTSEKNGTLLYGQSLQGESFMLIIDKGHIVAIAQNIIQSKFDGFDVSTSEWISVLYDFRKVSITLLRTPNPQWDAHNDSPSSFPN